MLRRAFLGAVGAFAASACGGAPVAPPAGEERPPLRLASLTDLVPRAELGHLIITRPREIAAIPWLIPGIAKIAPEKNLDRFAASTGLDLRGLHDAVIATHGPSTVYIVRYNGDPRVVERWFRSRIVAREKRVIERPDVVFIAGVIGTQESAIALLGTSVAVIQHGGGASRGPARIATLYAEGRLKRSPVALAEEPLKGLAERLGNAPALAFSLGPFEGELARGARGLLAGATAIGASARPSVREGILVSIAVAGDFSTSGEAARVELYHAWDDLTKSSLGKLLALDQPKDKPLATHHKDAVAITVELDPNKLATGLASATSARVNEIMR